jgi:hypothetical protein
MKDGKDSYGDKIESDFIGKGCREGSKDFFVSPKS